jgi:hypothetical protein
MCSVLYWVSNVVLTNQIAPRPFRKSNPLGAKIVQKSFRFTPGFLRSLLDATPIFFLDLKKTEGRLASKSARQARLRNPQVDRAGALPPAAWTGREEQVVAALSDTFLVIPPC